MPVLEEAQNITAATGFVAQNHSARCEENHVVLKRSTSSNINDRVQRDAVPDARASILLFHCQPLVPRGR